MKWRVKWEGRKVVRLIEEKTIPAIMNDVGLDVEANSKRELKKGHGVRTGTLRRSIHAAAPDHDFAGDGPGEQGGRGAQAKKVDGKFAIAVGSGLVYAMAIHQGWSNHAKLKGAFGGYHYLTRGVEVTKTRIGKIVEKHRLKK